MHARAEDALVNDQNTEDVRLKALKDAENFRLKALNFERKVQQYTARWKGVHHRIEKSLEEIKTSLEGDAIDSLELIKVKRNQLIEVREYLKESTSLVDAIINEDPEQTDTMKDAEAAKSVSAVSKI